MATKAAIAHVDTTPSFFKGFATAIIFNKPDFDTIKTVGALTNPRWLGHINQNTISWTGEAPTLVQAKNEQGHVVYVIPSAGSASLQIDLMSTSAAVRKEFYGATDVDSNINEDSSTWIQTGDVPKGVGWGGDELPIKECAFALVNDAQNEILLFPNAMIVASDVDGEKAIHARLNITAQATPPASDSFHLYPVMQIKAALQVKAPA